MSALLVVLGCIAAYFAIGLLYARSQYLRLWQQRRAYNQRHYTYTDVDYKWTNSETALAAAWRVPFWPVAVPYDAVRGPLTRWFTSPLDERRAHADQLRKDADNWARVVTTTDSESERAMAAELMRICRERADEVQP